MNSKPLRGIDAITLNAYFFSLNVQTLTLVPLLTPILVERFFSAELKGSALGTLRLCRLCWVFWFIRWQHSFLIVATVVLDVGVLL